MAPSLFQFGIPVDCADMMSYDLMQWQWIDSPCPPCLASDSSDMVLGSLLLYTIVVKPLLEANINDLDIDFVDIIDRRDVLFTIEDITESYGIGILANLFAEFS